MEENDLHRLELERLVREIWGPNPIETELSSDPDLRELQNQALAIAIRSYLQLYLDEAKDAL